QWRECEPELQLRAVWQPAQQPHGQQSVPVHGAGERWERAVLLPGAVLQPGVGVVARRGERWRLWTVIGDASPSYSPPADSRPRQPRRKMMPHTRLARAFSLPGLIRPS